MFTCLFEIRILIKMMIKVRMRKEMLKFSGKYVELVLMLRMMRFLACRISEDWKG
jgi:hypothetical protein